MRRGGGEMPGDHLDKKGEHWWFGDSEKVEGSKEENVPEFTLTGS